MKWGIILLLVCIVAVSCVAVSAAKLEGTNDTMGQQVQSKNQTQDQIPDAIVSQVQAQTQDQERQKNQTRAMNVSELHQQIQQRQQELEQEQAQLSQVQQRVAARYSNVSAFVHVLQNESQTRSLLGEGIGPQVSTYAQEFNNSLRAQIQAEERIQERNTFVRFFVGGDEQAAGLLEQETVRNQERIQQMQQLILQCQDCDPQIREMLQVQLQEMEEQQTRLRQLAQNEKQDKGIFGWLWK